MDGTREGIPVTMHEKMMSKHGLESQTDSLEQKIDSLFRIANHEQFEPGMISSFSKSLQSLSGSNPNAVLKILKQKLDSQTEDSTALAEMLSWASYQDSTEVRTEVVELLESGLSHQSSLVRDEAASGLSWLQGIESIDRIRSAAEEETVPELRDDMLELIRILETDQQRL